MKHQQYELLYSLDSGRLRSWTGAEEVTAAGAGGLLSRKLEDAGQGTWEGWPGLAGPWGMKSLL